MGTEMVLQPIRSVELLKTEGMCTAVYGKNKD